MTDLKIAEQCIPKECKDDSVSRRQVYCLKLASESDLEFVQALISMPSIEPEIIRCKVCKHHHYDSKDIPYCDRIGYGYGWKDNDYCSRAERLTVADVIEAITSELEGTIIVGFKNAPTIEPERKKGKWIYGEKSGQDGWYCSECGGFIPWYYDFYGLDNIDFIENFKTCPFCDSKMVSYTGCEMKGFEEDE